MDTKNTDTNFHVQGIERHRIQTDGKGITTLVALRGCPLKCRYCINMDILSSDRDKIMTPEELWDKVSIDYCYFYSTEGGVTFGGGESLLYAQPIIAFADILPPKVSINVETSLNVNLSDETFDALTKRITKFIVDIKSTDEKIYRDYTGIDNKLPLANLKRFVEKGLQDKVLVRLPVIPDFKPFEIALEEESYFKKQGFETDVFNYKIRDYMIK